MSKYRGTPHSALRTVNSLHASTVVLAAAARAAVVANALHLQCGNAARAVHRGFQCGVLLELRSECRPVVLQLPRPFAGAGLRDSRRGNERETGPHARPRESLHLLRRGPAVRRNLVLVRR